MYYRHGIFVERDGRAFGHTTLSKALRSEAENSFCSVARMLQMVSRTSTCPTLRAVVRRARASR